MDTNKFDRKRSNDGEYTAACGRFRTGGGRDHDGVLAVLLDAAILLHDPAGVLFLGENPDAASEYDHFNGVVWAAMCGARGTTKYSEATLRLTLRQAYADEFDTALQSDDEGQTWREAHRGSPDDAPEVLDKIASMVWAGLQGGTFNDR